GGRRCRRPAPAGRDGKQGVAAHRELLGRAGGRARVSPLHAAARVPRLARSRRAPLRASRTDRRVAPRPEPPSERTMTEFEPPKTEIDAPERTESDPAEGDGGVATATVDPYEILGIARDASQEDIEAAYQRFAHAPDLWIGSGPEREERLRKI